MRKTVVAVGWYADNKGHNNKNVSPLMQTTSFLKDMWIPHIRNQLRDQLGALIVYQSDCEKKLQISPEKNIFIVQSQRPPTQHHHNDSGATQMSGAMYAYCNEMDFMFIEQDCFVVGLREAYNWACQENVPIAFSMQNFTQDLSRGEHCFTFVSYKYITLYINKLLAAQWHTWDESRGFPELHMEEMFISDATRWPFGYGRKRPIKWQDPIYYLQQPTSDELHQVTTHLSKRFADV